MEAAGLACAARSADPLDRPILDLHEPQASLGDHEPLRSWPLTPERLAVIQVWPGEGGDLRSGVGGNEGARLGADRLHRGEALAAELAAEVAGGLAILHGEAHMLATIVAP